MKEYAENEKHMQNYAQKYNAKRCENMDSLCKNIEKYATNMQLCAQICSSNMQKYAKICTIYAKICIK